MTYTPTNFLESNALLALQAGEEASANQILSRMTDGELRDLRRTCWKLGALCEKWEGAGVDLTE